MQHLEHFIEVLQYSIRLKPFPAILSQSVSSEYCIHPPMETVHLLGKVTKRATVLYCIDGWLAKTEMFLGVAIAMEIVCDHSK